MVSLAQASSREAPFARTEREQGRTNGARSAPSLDKRTNFDDYRWSKPKPVKFNMLTFPNGDAECTATFERSSKFRKKMPLIDPETGEILDDVPRQRTTKEIVEAREKSINRTKTGIRRAIMGIGARHMLTLTYRENMLDLKRGWQDVARFLRAMRQSLGAYPYVIVAETQKRGAWHFHLAVLGRQDLELVRRHWPHGNIDAKFFDGDVAKMAKYMAKYVSKSFWQRDKDDGHRYRCSQRAKPRPVSITVEAESSEDIRHIMRLLFQERGLIGFAHTDGGKGTAGYYVWGCTWLDHPLEADP